MRSKFKVKGHKQQARNMRRIGMQAHQLVVDPMVAGMTLIENQARKNVRSNGSVLSGDLARNQDTVVFEKRRDRVGVETGATGPAIKNAHLIELGVRPHFQPRRGIMHPGHSARPYMGPAVSQKGPDALNEVRRRYALNLLALQRRMPK